MLKSASTPGYWRLSSIYLFYFALLGAITPFWNLYLLEQGYSAAEIGYLGAILLGTKVISPYLLGWLTDETGQPVRVIRYSNFFALLLFMGIFLFSTEKDSANGFVHLALVIAGFSFFWNAVVGQYEALTFIHLGDYHDRYGAIRACGSIGFIVAVTALGYLFEVVSVAYLPHIIAMLLLFSWLSSCWVKEIDEAEHVHDEPIASFAKTLLRRDVIAFFAGCFFVKFAHGPYYTFYTIYLEDYGYSKSLIGWLWSLGVIAELVMFFVIGSLMARFGLRTVLVFSAFVGVARWGLIGLFPQSLMLLVTSQLLHAINFAAYHAAAVNWVRKEFKPRFQGQAQALYSSVSFGAGSALGAIVSGLVWTDERSGAWTVLWLVAVGISVLSGLAFWLVGKHKELAV